MRFNVNLSSRNSQIKENTRINILNIFQVILKEINEKGKEFYDLMDLQVLTKILKNLKRVLEVNTKMEANIRNSDGKYFTFFQDLEEIMIDLPRMLFCEDKTPQL